MVKILKKLFKRERKKQKKQKLKDILDIFNNFQSQDKEFLKRRLLTYIPYANRITQQYENIRHRYLSLNVSLFTVISFFLTILLVYFRVEIPKIFPIFIGTLIFVFFSALNILYNLFRHPTPSLSQTTFWFYRGNVPDEINPEISNKHVTDFLNKFKKNDDKFIKEDLMTLFNLYIFQAHYYKLALFTRLILFIGFILYLVSFVIQIFFFLGIYL